MVKNAYPIGTRIYIDYISDGCYPKAVGHFGYVLGVDDAGQIHCRMNNNVHATVCKAHGDKFFKV